MEVLNLVSGQYQHVPLGTHANKHGRVIGHNLAGSYATFPGVVGTAVSKVCHLEIARTGLRERDARRAGFAYVTVTVRSGTKAAYFPGTRQMTVKMIAERCTGRLLGVQIVGSEGTGTASHLGKASYNGSGEITSENAVTGVITDTLTETLTAANGDKLTILCRQVATPTSPGVYSGTDQWTVTGGTGRFSGATGSGGGDTHANLNAHTFTKAETGTVSY